MSYQLEDDIPLITIKRPSLSDEVPSDYDRGFNWGRYTKSIRDPDMVRKFLRDFEPRNTFDCGFMEGLRG